MKNLEIGIVPVYLSLRLFGFHPESGLRSDILEGATSLRSSFLKLAGRFFLLAPIVCKHARASFSWLLVAFGTFLSIASFTTTEAEIFNYKITAAGTSNQTTFPVQTFMWTVTGKAIETWSTTEIKTRSARTSASASRGERDEDESFFIPAKDGQANISYSGSDDGAWGVTLDLDNDRLFTATHTVGSKSGSAKREVIQGKRYRITASTSGGNCSISVGYPAFVTDQHTTNLTAQHSAPGSVSVGEGKKFLSVIPFAAYPQPQNKGTVSNPLFEVRDNTDTVETFLENGNVFARTSYQETQRKPWSATQAGQAFITASDGEKLVTTSALTAPNMDTEWTVSDDNPNVETRMEGTRLFAKIFQGGPPNYHTADYRDPHWLIDESEMNRVLAYWRAGTYHANEKGIDGFAAGAGPTSNRRHSADYKEPFWVIDDTEMNRVLGYWRAGGYEVNSNGPDGYAPVAAQPAKAQTPSSKGQAQALRNKPEQKTPTATKALEPKH